MKRSVQPRTLEEWKHINDFFNDNLFHNRLDGIGSGEGNRGCPICSSFEDEIYNMELD